MATVLKYLVEENAVSINGVINPINLDTGELWDSADEANDWIANFVEPAPAPILTLVVTAVKIASSNDEVEIQQPFNLVVLTEGDVVSIEIEVQDGYGKILEIPNLTSVLPIIGQFGSPMKVVTVDIIESIATVVTKFPMQGMWKVTENEVNMHIDNPDQHFSFEGLQFKVKENVTT